MRGQEGIPETWESDIFFHDLDRSIRFANVRCLSRETNIAGVLNLENDEDQLNAYLCRLNELTLTPSEQQNLATGMVDLARKTENATPDVTSTAAKMIDNGWDFTAEDMAFKLSRTLVARSTRLHLALAAYCGRITDHREVISEQIIASRWPTNHSELDRSTLPRH